jgi:hypothetical protein
MGVPTSNGSAPAYMGMPHICVRAGRDDLLIVSYLDRRSGIAIFAHNEKYKEKSERYEHISHHQPGVLPGPGMARINRATCSGSSSWTKCRAPGIRNSSEPGRNSWNVRATPLFREGSASPKMIRTGRLNSFSLGIICVRDWTMGNKSSFRRKNRAGTRRGVELLIQQRHELTSDGRSIMPNRRKGRGHPLVNSHPMKDSAQVTAPGAIISMIAAVSSRPNKQNRSARSPMPLPIALARHLSCEPVHVRCRTLSAWQG